MLTTFLPISTSLTQWSLHSVLAPKFFQAAIPKCNKSTLADRYYTIKKSIIDFFLLSENQCLTSLLSDFSLGDRKPSKLVLTEMRKMGGEGYSDSILSNIWLRALPTTVRSIIASMPPALLCNGMGSEALRGITQALPSNSYSDTSSSCRMVICASIYPSLGTRARSNSLGGWWHMANQEGGRYPGKLGAWTSGGQPDAK